MSTELKEELSQLFTAARKKGGMEYLFTLTRVDGINFGRKDEMLQLRNDLAISFTKDIEEYCRFATDVVPLSLFVNLLNCSVGKPYEIRPFKHLRTGAFPNWSEATLIQIVEDTIRRCLEANQPSLADRVQMAYNANILVNCTGTKSDLSGSALEEALASVREFLSELSNQYFAERLSYKGGLRFHRLPGFEVLELLMNDDGLYGFSMHFSNGSSATFERHANSVNAVNVVPGTPINFMIGLTDDLRQEWRVGDKPLYEVIDGGRYNTLGEWKPIIFPAKATQVDSFQKEVRTLSQDVDVMGVLLYMRLTGYRCIEFVLRTNLDIPGSYSRTTGEVPAIHIWKCPLDEYHPNVGSTCVYDCWLELATTDVAEVEQGLSNIGRFISVLCFPFGATYSWRVKYKMTHGEGGRLTPTHEEMKVVGHVLEHLPDTEDAILLQAALDWQNRGNMSSNVFTRFLCYYVAMESVANAVAEGAQLGRTPLVKVNKKERKDQREACIDEKRKELLANDPIEFVSRAYFDCVQSLKTRTKLAAAAVFGGDHKYLKWLFEASESGDMSLSEIRGKLAHGGIALLNKQDEHLVRKHLYEMKRVSEEFLLRILFRLTPDEAVPTWSQAFQVTFSTADPRSTMWSSTEDIFPKPTDWRIRPEWCE